MKAVMLSIRPEWIEKIYRGEKDFEVRRTFPNYHKILTPFRCYIYCTKPKQKIVQWVEPGEEMYGTVYDGPRYPVTIDRDVNAGMWIYGKWGCVVGEFTCDYAECLNNLFTGENMYHFPAGKTCLTMEQLEQYGKGKRLWAWHITDPVWYYRHDSDYLYGRPLSDFRSWGAVPGHHMKVPPQSWCYVEESGGMV